MWKPIYHPGPWGQFLKRKDNVGMPLMEVRKKYLIEQLNSDNLSLETPVSSPSNAGNPLASLRLIKVASQTGADQSYVGDYSQSIAKSLNVRTNGTVAWAKLEYTVPKGGGSPFPNGDTTVIRWIPSFSKWEVRRNSGNNSFKAIPYLSPVTTSIDPFYEYTANVGGTLKYLTVTP